MESLQL